MSILNKNGGKIYPCGTPVSHLNQAIGSWARPEHASHAHAPQMRLGRRVTGCAWAYHVTNLCRYMTLCGTNSLTDSRMQTYFYLGGYKCCRIQNEGKLVSSERLPVHKQLSDHYTVWWLHIHLLWWWIHRQHVFVVETREPKLSYYRYRI